MAINSERHNQIRTILLTILAFSISCYCLGAIVLQGASVLRPATATPTATLATVTPSPTPLITWE
jgi:hypothetical protein